MKVLDQIKLFVSSGKYLSMVELESKLSELRDNIRNYQASKGQIKYQWSEQGVIGIFEKIHIFDTDSTGLKEYLMQLGLLPKVLKIKWSALSENQKLELGQGATNIAATIRFTPNSSCKLNPVILNEYRTNIQKFCIGDRVAEWKRVKTDYDIRQKEWNSLKYYLLNELQPNSKIKIDQGTLICISANPQINTLDALNILGIDAIKEVGDIDNELLMIYRAKGFMDNSEMEGYRKLRDIKVRYLLLEIDIYIRKVNFLQNRLMRLSKESQRSRFDNSDHNTNLFDLPFE